MLPKSSISTKKWEQWEEQNICTSCLVDIFSTKKARHNTIWFKQHGVASFVEKGNHLKSMVSKMKEGVEEKNKKGSTYRLLPILEFLRKLTWEVVPKEKRIK